MAWGRRRPAAVLESVTRATTDGASCMAAGRTEVRHTLGATPTGGADALLDRKILGELGDPGDDGGGQFDAEAGYGVSAFGGRFTGTPWLGFATSPDSSAYRLGWRLAPAYHDASDMTFGLEAVRRERTFDAEHQAQARLTLRW